MTEALILAGADIVKIGIGPGSVCTTRSVAGVGYPQLSSISECSDAAHGLGGHVMADGGCKFPGDVSKAFGADVIKSYIKLKNSEIKNFKMRENFNKRKPVSQWEKDNTLDC